MNSNSFLYSIHTYNSKRYGPYNGLLHYKNDKNSVIRIGYYFSYKKYTKSPGPEEPKNKNNDMIRYIELIHLSIVFIESCYIEC